MTDYNFTKRIDNIKEIIKHLFGPKAISQYIIVSIIFLLGHLTGYNKAMHKYEKKEVVNQQLNTNQVTSDIQNKTANTQDANSSYTEKFFNKKGVLVHEIEKKYENRASDLSFTKHTDLSIVNSAITSATFSTIEERQESNWLIGFSIPVKFHPDFQDVNAQFGYMLLGPIYITAQTDYKFSKPTVGFLVNF